MRLFQSTVVASFLLGLSNNAVGAAIDTSADSELATRALGINCRGSFLCTGSAGSMDEIVELAFANQGGCSVGPGKQMYCDGNICAYTQHTEKNINPELARNLLTSLKAHGCKGCGSIPLGYPGTNDPSDGILTVNYVGDNHGCTGICHPQCDA